MSFNKKAFMAQKFEARTVNVKVTELKEWFDDQDDPHWTIRGLTGAELARVNEAASTSKVTMKMLEALAGKLGEAQINTLKESLGLGSETPADLARRLEMLVCGSMEPECDLEVAVKLAEFHPIVFHHLTNEITRLTGLGAAAVAKPVPSGKTSQ